MSEPIAPPSPPLAVVLLGVPGLLHRFGLGLADEKPRWTACGVTDLGAGLAYVEADDRPWCAACGVRA